MLGICQYNIHGCFDSIHLIVITDLDWIKKKTNLKTAPFSTVYFTLIQQHQRKNIEYYFFNFASSIFLFYVHAAKAQIRPCRWIV